MQEVDLEPISLTEVIDLKLRLRFYAQLTLMPELDESQQLVCLRHAELGIDLFGATRQEVEAELPGEIALLWRNYACESDERLTPGALRLKHALRAAIREVSDAT